MSRAVASSSRTGTTAWRAQITIEPFDATQFDSGKGAMGLCSFCGDPALWMRRIPLKRDRWGLPDGVRLVAYCSYHGHHYLKPRVTS